MTVQEFLELVWPDSGFYCVSWPFSGAADNRPRMSHKTFSTIADAAAFCESQKNSVDMYFCVHTLKEQRVWNPTKLNWKTKEPGAWEVRSQANTLAAKTLYMDIDVKTDSPQHYATQVEALQALQAFCVKTKLPKPSIVSSGGGLHVYWVLTESIPSARWKEFALKLKRLTEAERFKADPVVIGDNARILRVVGTFNHKQKETPRPVAMLTTGTPQTVEALEQILSEALIGHGIDPQVAKPPSIGLDGELVMDDVPSNLTKTYTPVTPGVLLEQCAQIRDVVSKRGDVSEPLWYHSLNIVRHLENGRDLAHKMSAGHATYSQSETDAKLDQLEMKNIGPTGCATFDSVSGNDLCKSCPHFAANKNPLSIARLRDEAPAPVVQLVTSAPPQQIPAPPKPYARLKSGGVAIISRNADGDEDVTQILPYDLYPLCRVSDATAQMEQQIWRVELPRNEIKDFNVDADALYEKRKFMLTLANQGIYPHPGMIAEIQTYMIAYINELQRQQDAEMQYRHLGWNNDYTSFILPEQIILSDGSTKPATLTAAATNATDYIRKVGTLEKQIELLHFYDAKAYVAQQFYILAGLAAPIFHMTGQHGVIVNASGDPGTSKSTSLYTVASFWGHPTTYPLNGTNRGATANARTERISTLANLPVCVDEITHMPPQEAVAFAMSVTQPTGRLRLTRNGTERKTHDGTKSTIVLTTANSSLHTLLSYENSAAMAGSMRVMEIPFLGTYTHRKFEAEDYLHEVTQNYGHIGPTFVRYVIRNREKIEVRLRTLMREIDAEAAIISAERYWTAAIASALTAGEIARELGLLSFDIAHIRKWVVEKQVPSMRGLISEEYATPLGTLTDYIAESFGDLVITSGGAIADLVEVRAHPRGKVLGHYDQKTKVLWLLRKGFKDYCARIGANDRKILQDLNVAKMNSDGQQIRIVTHQRIKKVLGAGTDYATPQVWCCTVDMTHPEIADIPVVGLVTQDGKRVTK